MYKIFTKLGALIRDTFEWIGRNEIIEKNSRKTLKLVDYTLIIHKYNVIGDGFQIFKGKIERWIDF